MTYLTLGQVRRAWQELMLFEVSRRVFGKEGRKARRERLQLPRRSHQITLGLKLLPLRILLSLLLYSVDDQLSQGQRREVQGSIRLKLPSLEIPQNMQLLYKQGQTLALADLLLDHLIRQVSLKPQHPNSRQHS